MSLTMDDDGVEAPRGRSRRRNSLLSKQLAVAVKSVQWSYAIFWSSSPTQSGVLEWGEGCYNGEMKKRKKRYEVHYKHVLQRSNQLRKLYLCMREGDSTNTISTTHDDGYHNCNNTTSMLLSPDDLSDEEWYYVVSILPGRALATGETIWLCNAQYADSKLFSRSLLARSASIQTVVCFPYLGGVIELGVTELISEDPSLLQHIKSCLLETSKPDCPSNNFSAHQYNADDDKKNQMKIKISEVNSALQENPQIQFGISDLMLDEDLHYKRTVSTLLKYAADKSKMKNSHHRQPELVSSNSGSSFLRWKQPSSNLLLKHSNSQNVLRKILHDVPLMHSVDTKRLSTNKMFGLNQDDPSVKRKENEKFSVLRAMVPTVNEVDKEEILNNTIKYLQELEERVEELESCMGSVNFVGKQRKTKKSLNDSVLIEETSGNYDDSTKIDGNSGETEQAVTVLRDETHFRVKLKETEVVMEVRCSYRDYIVADIMETLSKLHMDAFSVRSHTLNGFLTLNLKAKLREAAVASVGMIKRELRRVIGRPVYYVLLQCGTKEYRSKLSKGHNDNALWNQKFVFDFPMSQWKKLTHIKFRTMDKELFKDGGFVGETIIDLKGIITEGGDRGYMEVKPAPYNVVLDDDTFKGVLKLGFRFTAADKLRRKAWEQKIEGKNSEEAMNSTTLTLMKVPLVRFTAAWANENEDANYHQSRRSIDPNDQSASETPVYSSMSIDSFVYPRTCSESTSGFSDQIDHETNSFCSDASPSDWPVLTESKSSKCLSTGLEMQSNGNLPVQEISEAELETMKERFSKLLLGEDMSGSGKGVCTAVTISNAITNLYATVFGQNLRLEPLETEKRALWKREMKCLLSVCDYIVEFIPRCQSLSNGTTVEVMESRPRADIYINLPALRKLDSMLMEALDSFQNTEFWYAEEGSLSMKSARSATGSFRKVIVQRKEEKWWLPVPLVPPEGLSDIARKQLKNKRESTNQIHKAAMAINSSILSEMEIPDSYMATLPKCGKSSVGDSIYRYMSGSGRFFPEKLLDCLNIASEHEAVQLADRVEASMYTWRRKACLSNSKNSWNLVKDLMSTTERTDKNYVMAERAETLLFCLKQRYPELSQTSLDICKIQYNKDVGKAVLESYSRVLEGLAFNIVAWIDDVLYVDKTMSGSE
ncbi:hypothetical protein HID58_053182 [Brassica napus]|uniref:PRONE domain-containing protein n=1 Tax=Brassica napus TaxID=3708 RepID=A0ABQ8AES5_BRANA|nr:hypothetical protein HID58_053182 [Brassica napus]